MSAGTKYLIKSRDQSAGRNHNMKTDNKSSVGVEQLKHLSTTVTNVNFIQKEIKSSLKSGNACYHSVQNLMSSRLLSKNIKIGIYRNIILPAVLYGCETWSVILREKRRLRVFENRVLRKIFRTKRDEATVEWRRLHNEELYDLYTSPNIILAIK